VSGTITIPEVAHDTEENEFVVRVMSNIGGLACALTQVDLV